MKRRRALNRLPDTAQRSLSLSLPPTLPSVPPPPSLPQRFAPEQSLFFADRPLETYLRDSKQLLPVTLKSLLSEVDFSRLMGAQASVGRRPIHPRVFVSLIIYGLLMKQRSLRELERLARLDLGAMFLCGGLQPDHSTLGHFIHEYRDELTTDFFVSLTRHLGQKMGLEEGAIAIDGTTLQAVASAHRTLGLEAARAHAAHAAQQAKEAPERPSLQQTAQTAQEAVTVGELRTLVREDKGKTGEVTVCPAEPDAVVQPLKTNVFAPAYKPTIAVHEKGLIVAQKMDNASELVHVAALLDQQAAVTGLKPTAVLADSGFYNETMLDECLKRDLNVLIPPGRERSKPLETTKTAQLHKQLFVFNAERDCLTCPANKTLEYRERGIERSGRTYRVYRASPADCAGCALRKRCTTTKSREVKRYPSDEHKEAMRDILKHPQARADYRCRSTIVEPVFGRLRYDQGLIRFTRRGQLGVAVEFALHCMAYNAKVAARRRAAARQRVPRRHWRRRQPQSHLQRPWRTTR